MISSFGTQDPMANPSAWFTGDQWAIVEKLRAEDAQTMHKLRRRIQDLEGVMVYHRNFLPEPLKAQAEAILFPNGTDNTPTL